MTRLQKKENVNMCSFRCDTYVLFARLFVHVIASAPRVDFRIQIGPLFCKQAPWFFDAHGGLICKHNGGDVRTVCNWTCTSKITEIKGEEAQRASGQIVGTLVVLRLAEGSRDMSDDLWNNRQTTEDGIHDKIHN